MDQINLRVLIKEPRGFTRVLQVLFSILTWSTTASFSTTSRLQINCPESLMSSSADYKISYPFDLRNTEISAPSNCSDDNLMITDTFPIDFSSTAMLYVLVCILSLVYALGAAFYYSVFSAKYEADPLAPMVDLCLSILFTICWIIITFVWALNVSDIKHYTHPHYFKDHLSVCQDEDVNCQPSNPGKWSSLTVSIVCGFTCVVLWLGSCWFIFKETTLHKKPTYQAPDPSMQAQHQTNI